MASSALLPILVGLFIWPNFLDASGDRVTRSSCLDHFLNGNSADGIQSVLGSRSGRTYSLECRMPVESESQELVHTWVRSALEQWTPVEPGGRFTTAYQITDRPDLKALVEESTSCIQEVFVRWPRWTGPLPSESNMIGFTLESVQGEQRVFQRNFSTFEPYEEAVALESTKHAFRKHAGVLHVLGTDPHPEAANLTAWVRVGALQCSRMIVEQEECLFELNEHTDWLKLGPVAQGSVQFAFRTDQPDSPFLRFVLADGNTVNVDLLYGYLLTVDHLVHPVKRLADGRWHSLVLDVDALTLQVDGTGPLISVSALQNAKPLAEVRIQLNGQVSAVRLGPESPWLCGATTSLETQLTPQILRRICASYEDNLCRCRGPPPVLSKAVCKPMDGSAGFQLGRVPDRLAFFLLPGFSEKSRVRVVFKSESPLGLVFFGLAHASKSRTRVQVHFIEDRMYAAVCSKTRGEPSSERCRSCFVARPGGFATGAWTHVAFFHHHDYQFLAVDDQVCQLAPDTTASGEVHLLDGARLYDPRAETSVLFVGGTFYSKHRRLLSVVASAFRQQFFENTREKPPSLRGCVAEVVVNGERKDLAAVFASQQSKVSMVEDAERQVFAMQPGCPECAVPEGQCGSAPCRALSAHLQTQPVCDCAAVFALPEPGSGRCLTETSPASLTLPGGYGSLALSSATPLRLGRVDFPNENRRPLQKLWLLVRLPTANSDPVAFLRIGELRLSTADRGSRLIMEMDSTKEEFQTDNSDDRLHLISIQRVPSPWSMVESSMTIQVDNDVRRIEQEDIHVQSARKIHVSPVVVQEPETEFAGCIAELAVSFDYDEKSTKGSTGSVANRASTIDLLKLLVDDVYDVGDPAETHLIQHTPCGIRDPSLWTGNSSSFGTVGPYDPVGENRTSSTFSLTVTVVLVLLVLAVLIGYCYRRQQRFRQYKLNTQRYRPSIGKEEKTPLKNTYLDTSASSTEHSHVDLTDVGYTPPQPVKSNNSAHHNGNHNGVVTARRALVKEPTPSPPPTVEPLPITNLPGSPRRLNRPIVRRMPPNGSHANSPLPSPRIATPAASPCPKPIVIAAQRAPIARTDDL